MFQRPYIQEIKKRIHEPRRFMQVFYGPRQVGKTTMLKQALQDYQKPFVFETADDIVGADSTWLRKVWAQARLTAKQFGQEVLLVIDEVQKISNWSEVVKKEWDADTFSDCPVKVVLLGSSSLLIQKGLVESLAGRFEAMFIPHWSYQEMSEAFGWTVEQFMWFGGYPGSAELVSDEKRWKRYVKDSLIETSLSRDILMLTRIEKPALLHRLFEIGCNYSAQILSLAKIQGELMEKGNITTLSNYLSLLKSAGLLSGLEKYAGGIIRKRSSKPKFQVFNNALLSAQSERLFHDAVADGRYWSRLYESAVGTHLLNKSYTEDYSLYYWNENSMEVDYVIERGSRFVTLEVKSGKDSANDGMSVFDSKFHPSALYTIGTNGIDVGEFLKMNPADLL